MPPCLPPYSPRQTGTGQAAITTTYQSFPNPGYGMGRHGAWEENTRPAYPCLFFFFPDFFFLPVPSPDKDRTRLPHEGKPATQGLPQTGQTWV